MKRRKRNPPLTEHQRRKSSQGELQDAEGGVDAQQDDALPAGQLLLEQSGEDHQGHDDQHHGDVEDQAQIQAGIQQQVLAGNIEGSQRNGNTGNQHQVEDVGADDVANTQGSVAAPQGGDGGDQLCLFLL